MLDQDITMFHLTISTCLVPILNVHSLHLAIYIFSLTNSHYLYFLINGEQTTFSPLLRRFSGRKESDLEPNIYRPQLLSQRTYDLPNYGLRYN